MGSVYVALQRGLNRKVALKIPHHTISEDMRKRFLREGETLARLSHPNVVRVFDADIEHDVAFLAMELIQGQNLNEYLKRQRPSLEQAVQWGIQLADALDYIHSQNVIHRDIKSLNIIINDRAQPVLVDFGIARDENMPQITRHDGAFMGTFRYASPESFEGKTLTYRSDLYSIGVVLYRCLTGSYPYDGTSITGFMNTLMKGEHTPAHAINPSVPAWLSDIIDTCLSRDPSKRMASGRALKETLAGGFKEQPSSVLSDTQNTVLPTPGGLAEVAQADAEMQSETRVGEHLSPRSATDTAFTPISLTPATSNKSKYVAAAAAVGVLLILLMFVMTRPPADIEPTLAQQLAEGEPTVDAQNAISTDTLASIDAPPPIATLFEATDLESLESQLRTYRNNAVLTYGPDPGRFGNPAACYVIVYTADSITTILSPEESNGSRTNLVSGTQHAPPLDAAFPNQGFIWVLLLE